MFNARYSTTDISYSVLVDRIKLNKSENPN